MSLHLKLKVIAAISALLLTGCDAVGQRLPAAAEAAFVELGSVGVEALPELSGLAASRRQPGAFWAVNDSGNAAALVALGPGLLSTRQVPVDGVINHDWEDLASFELDGEPWLLIADSGDNFSLRSEIQLILLPEPAPEATRVRPARVLRLRYEDGPRDCEAVAVDARRRRVLLADKGREPVGLYEVALDSPEPVQTARRVAEFPALVPTTAPRVQALGSAHSRGLATAMDVSADGRRMLVLTYLSATLFERAADQTWAQALAQPRLSLRVPRLRGFESIAFDREGGAALLGTESQPARFFAWPLPPR
jgi:hypothetical protein